MRQHITDSAYTVLYAMEHAVLRYDVCVSFVVAHLCSVATNDISFLSFGCNFLPHHTRKLVLLLLKMVSHV